MLFGEPGGEDFGGVRGERRGAVFAALAAAVCVRAGAEMDIMHGQPGQFGDTQSGLGGEDQQGVIAAAVPGGPVGGGEQRVEFAAGQEADDRGGGAFGLDCQDAADQGRVLGGAQARATTWVTEDTARPVNGAFTVTNRCSDLVAGRACSR